MFEDEQLGRGSEDGDGDGDDDERGEGDRWQKLMWSWQLEKKRGEEKDQEKEWRAIWKYIERRAGGEVGGGC